MWLQWIYEWCAKRAKPATTMEEILSAEAERLLHDTVNRELQLIDDQHKVEANKAKAKYLLEKIAEGGLRT